MLNSLNQRITFDWKTRHGLNFKEFEFMPAMNIS